MEPRKKVAESDKTPEREPEVSLGTEDVGPGPAADPGSATGGMIMGPNHPIFQAPFSQGHHPQNPTRPPGARWDPINPIHPQGDIDPDELMPPGEWVDPVHPGVRPPAAQGGTGGRPPIGRPPRGFPPGPGGGGLGGGGTPPFF